MDPVVHFQVPYEDSDRLTQFYSTAFGWQLTALGEQMGDYITAATTETDANHTVQRPGAINGGFFKRTNADQLTEVVIAVKDIKESSRKVEAAGGKVMGGANKPGEPDDIPGVGLYSSFIDSEGNRVGMLQPAPSMGGQSA